MIMMLFVRWRIKQSWLVFQLDSFDTASCYYSSLSLRICRIKVLIIDDWGVAKLNATQRHLLFELIELRDRNSSLIITSQYPMSSWHEAFGDPTIADSVLDRIVHNAHQIERKHCGSIRKKLGVNGGDK